MGPYVTTCKIKTLTFAFDIYTYTDGRVETSDLLVCPSINFHRSTFLIFFIGDKQIGDIIWTYTMELHNRYLLPKINYFATFRERYCWIQSIVIIYFKNESVEYDIFKTIIKTLLHLMQFALLVFNSALL